jgi:two-component system, NtrC family, response regulator AlgB
MRALIVDPDEMVRGSTCRLLETMGHEVTALSGAEAAWEHLAKQPADVALVELKCNGQSGLEVMPAMQARCPGLDVVIYTAFPSFESAVEAVRLGAADYLPKPFTTEQLEQVMQRISKARKLRGRVAELESRITSSLPKTDLTTLDANMERVFHMGLKVAATPTTILLLGESGTGKTVLARHLHENSPYRENRFITVSCPSLSRELLESELFGHTKGAFTGATGETWGKVAAAEGGTLFLDEIGELPLEIQPKLLRLLQEREYERVGEAKPRKANVRLMVATNRDLAEAVRSGRFREDLYYRVNVVPLVLPPLRERRADLLNIATGYLQFCATQCGKRMMGFTPEVERALQRYEWPGNLRELRNVIERAVILADQDRIDLDDLPEQLSHAANGAASPIVHLGGEFSLRDVEHEHIRRIIRSSPTMEKAAQVLGIDSVTLYRKRKRYAL